MKLHRVPLFVWAIFVTAILLLLRLPVLAGKIVSALNLTVCWVVFLFNFVKIGKDYQQVTGRNWNLNDCTPELFISNFKLLFL